MRHPILLVAALCCIRSFSADAPPAPPKPDYPLIPNANLTDEAAARAAWKPMGATAPVGMAGANVIRLPCNFAGTKIDRASWDISLNLDLAACQGVGFQVFCGNPAPVSHFSFYMQSGAGWYSANFAPQSKDAWSTIKILKSATRVEGTPAGWGSIQTIRISAWRSGNTDTEFFIAGLGLLGADAPIAVVRGESVAKNSPREVESVNMFTETVARMLQELDLPFCVVSDLDLTPERLKNKKLLILPHNPAMPDDVASKLLAFLQNGGKIIGFYSLPEKLRAAAGIDGGRHIQGDNARFSFIQPEKDVLKGAPEKIGQHSWNISEAKAVAGKSRVAAKWLNAKGEDTGDAAIVVSDNWMQMTHVLLNDDAPNKRRLVLAMVGHFLPEFWEKAATAAFRQVGFFGPYTGMNSAVKGISQADSTGSQQDRMHAVCIAMNEAERALKLEKHYDLAIDSAAKANSELVTAYCAVQKSQPNEHRGIWCHSAFGVQGMSWDEAIKLLADNGFTAVLPNMLWGGVAYYESNVLPVDPSVKEKGDQIAQCLAACKKHGLACHVWKVNWNMGWNVPKEFVEKIQKEGRNQVLLSGKPEPKWLCPSHPENQKLEIDSMVEVATKYDVDGIHFDYIRYPGNDSCFCPGCRERFEASLGEKVKNWPAEVGPASVPAGRDAGPTLREKWLDFRRANITKVVAGVSDIVRKAKPKMKISAAVFSNWNVDRDGVGQDWKLWCEKGYLDFVCPMDYTPEPMSFENIVAQQVEWAGKVPLYPGIGLSCWQPNTDICKLIEMIQITRKFKTGGFTVFCYDVSSAKDVIPLCGIGITKK
ncbi:MAG TPA: family 10 glycosylhydrolase [Planctomycetota bacterium]|jgi:uncharacterized lipoprotein YddW (UPF0748 family)